MSPRLPIQHQHSQTALNNLGFPVASIPCSPIPVGPGARSGQPDHQAKNSVFSNALSSPVRRSLQHYHLTQGGNYQMPTGNGPRNSDANNAHNQQNRDANSPSSESMDMHADSPGHEFTY